MNTKPNLNYPLPEKWYVERTLENAEKLNNLLRQLYPGKPYGFGTQLEDYDEVGILRRIHFIHKPKKPQDKTTNKIPREGYTKVTYEDLFLAYMIPEKWYCINAPTNLFNRWRRLNGVETFYGTGRYLVLSKHDRDYSYFWGGNLSGLKRTKYYDDYKEISLEDFTTLLDILEQKKNTKPMKKLNIKKVQVDISKLTVKHLRDMCDIVSSLGFTYWNLSIIDNCKYFRKCLDDQNSFGVYTHREGFTTLTYEQFIEHFKTKEEPMNNNIPTEVIIPITEFAKIVNVACEEWKKKLRNYTMNNIQEDCVSIKVSREFYDQMITASTTRSGINQADVINSVLPIFKHDPYKVFKDAEKEGKVVQYLRNDNKWVDGSAWHYDFPIERYRIKHKHQDLIDEWEASGRTKIVQFFTKIDEIWKDVDCNRPLWDEYVEYRFKPEPKYVPFTFEDAEVLLNQVVRSKTGSSINVITTVHKIGHVHIGAYSTDFDNLFKNFTFLDGSPCGKLIQNN